MADATPQQAQQQTQQQTGTSAAPAASTADPASSEEAMAAALAEYQAAQTKPAAPTPAEQPPAQQEQQTKPPAQQPPTEDPAVKAANEAYAQREQVLLRRQQEVKAEQERWRSEQAETQRQLQAFQAAQTSAKADPTGFFRSMGFDAKTARAIAQKIWLDEAGEAAPKELQEQRHLIDVNSNVAKLEAQVQHLQQQLQAQNLQALEAQFFGNSATQIAALPKDKFQWTHNLREDDPEEFYRTLKEAGQSLFGQLGYIPQPEELAQRIEEREARLARRYNRTAAAPTTPTTPQPTHQAAPQPTATITNQITTSTPPLPALPETSEERIALFLKQIEAGTFKP